MASGVIRITESELIDALAAAASGDAPEEAKTAQELATETGVVLSTTQKALRALFQQGRLQTYRVRRIGMDGRNTLVPAYTITPHPQGATP